MTMLEERMKRRAAMYWLIQLVDEHKGEVTINSDKVKRVFNDENEYVHIEYTDGSIGLIADADFETLDGAVKHYEMNHNPFRVIAL